MSVFVEFDTGKLDFGMNEWDDKQVRLLEEPLNEGFVNSRLVVKDEDCNQYDLVTNCTSEAGMTVLFPESKYNLFFFFCFTLGHLY